MDVPVVAVVMAGGTGTRLYPASRADRPKQFRSFGGERSLLARTVDRCSFADEVVVLTGERHLDRVREHAPGTTVLVEPAPRDTGPALIYAAAWLDDLFEECVLLAVPSDHVVGGGFVETARRAVRVAAETDGLVTLGVEPTRPAPEYGYVEPAPTGETGFDAAEVARFREKPDAGTAAELVDAGCLWNAGIFAWTPTALLDAAGDSPLSDFVHDLAAGEVAVGFEAVDAVSVDHAVLERAAGTRNGPGVYVVPAEFAWDDLGSWDALARVLDADPDGNVALVESDDCDDDLLLALDAGDNVVATDDKHVSLVGVSDLAVVAFDDRVLVVPKAEAQRVREVVAALREEGQF